MEKTKTILDEAKSNIKRDEASKYVAELYHNDKERYDRACDLISKLGVGGLWRGVELAIMHTAKALEKEQTILRGKIDNLPTIEIVGPKNG